MPASARLPARSLPRTNLPKNISARCNVTITMQVYAGKPYVGLRASIIIMHDAFVSRAVKKLNRFQGLKRVAVEQSSDVRTCICMHPS